MEGWGLEKLLHGMGLAATRKSGYVDHVAFPRKRNVDGCVKLQKFHLWRLVRGAKELRGDTIKSILHV